MHGAHAQSDPEPDPQQGLEVSSAGRDGQRPGQVETSVPHPRCIRGLRPFSVASWAHWG